MTTKNNLAEVERQSRALMTAHGVGTLAFSFDGAKRRIGQTRFQRVQTPTGVRAVPFIITLSRHFAERMPMHELGEVMLHEIAHAKAGVEAGHGPVWKAHARALGIAADRCYTTETTIERAIQGRCPNCNKDVGGMHRLPLRVKYHRPCGFKTPIVWYRGGVEIPLHDMPARYQTEYNRRNR